jgi:hypothetical protein
MIRPVHTKLAIYREKKVQSARLQSVFIAVCGAADPDKDKGRMLHSLTEVAFASTVQS